MLIQDQAVFDIVMDKDGGFEDVVLDIEVSLIEGLVVSNLSVTGPWHSSL